MKNKIIYFSRWFPLFWMGGAGAAIGKYVFVLKKYRGAKKAEYIIFHEKVHSKDQRDTGLFKWFFLYIFWPPFRLKAEVKAYRADFYHIIKAEKLRLNGKWAGRIRNKYAVFLSGWNYFKMTSLKNAKKIVNEWR